MGSKTREVSPTIETDAILTMRELAEYLKIGRQSAYHLVWRGEIPSFTRGRSRRVRRSAVDEWIHRQEQEHS